MRSKLFALAFVTCMAAHATSIYNFDGDTVGTTTQFTDISNGLSATFLSPGDPGGFVIQPTIFDALSGNVLGDPGPNGLNGLPLEIDFSSNLSAISLVFATADFGTPSRLTLTAFEGTSQVGSVVNTGMVLAGFTFPEGETAFEGNPFNRVVISSTAPDFAIDNVVVAAAAPEPVTELLTGLGLVGIGLIGTRRRARAKEQMTQPN